MTATVVVDTFESSTLEHGLQHYGLDTIRQNMVKLGYADIFWYGLEAKKFTLEHKTIAQAMAEMGQRLDDQLRKHSQHADDVGLIIDGIATANPKGGCDFWEKSKDGKYFYKRGSTTVNYENFQAYIWSIQKMGITVYRFEDLDTLCRGVAAYVYNSLKPEHGSLKGYTRTAAIIQEPNPEIETYIRTLIGLGHASIGEKTARKILDEYKTPWDFFRAGGDATRVVGRAVLINAMRAIGRKIF